VVYRVGEGSTMREEIMIHHEVLNSLLEKGYVTNSKGKESLKEERIATLNLEGGLIVNVDDGEGQNVHSKEKIYAQIPRTNNTGMSFCFPRILNEINENP
jgi:hypothetical protein